MMPQLVDPDNIPKTSMAISGTDLLEIPNIRPIFQAYVREYPRKIWPYMVQYLQFRILKLPLKTLFHLFHCIVSHIPNSKKTTQKKKATCSGTRGHVPKQGLSDVR